MISTYRAKNNGQNVEIDIQDVDGSFVTCKLPGRATERIPRAEFDAAFELQAPGAVAASAPDPVPAGRPRYTDRATGKEVSIEVQDMDLQFVVCRRPGRGMERISRKEFEDAYELQLPKANPATIPAVIVDDGGRKADPAGQAIPSTVSAQNDPVMKILRAHGDDLRSIDDRVSALAAKIDAIHRVVVAPPEAPSSPTETPKAPTS